MLYLVDLPLRYKGSEVINCLCNMFFFQIYPLLITTLQLVNQEPIDYSLALTDPVVKVSFQVAGALYRHHKSAGNLQVVSTLGERRAKTAFRYESPH